MLEKDDLGVTIGDVFRGYILEESIALQFTTGISKELYSIRHNLLGGDCCFHLG